MPLPSFRTLISAPPPAETIVTGLPQGGHSTRDVVFSTDGARMFVSTVPAMPGELDLHHSGSWQPHR